MPINLPNFKNKNCQMIGTCGAIQTDDEILIAGLTQVNGVLSSQYRAGNNRPILTAVLGQRDDRHLHLDVYRTKTLAKHHDQEENSTIDAIQKLLDPFLGVNIKTLVFGRFVLPFEELPPESLIRSLSFQRMEGDLGISMKGAEIEFHGKLPFTMDWRLFEKRTQVRVEFQTRIATKLSSDYLIQMMAMMESAFQLYAMGKRPDA